jgi:protoheme IX farnesyltransferase
LVNKKMLRDYYSLTKSGLVYGNLIPVIGGFAVAARTSGAAGVNFAASTLILTLAATLIGIALVMASGCVFNNVIDRDVDAEMARTKNRPLVEGRILPAKALAFGIALGIIGFATLALWTNWLTVAVAAAGWIAYVILYSLWAKRKTVYGTAIGSIAGAMPPVVGYAAAAGRLDLGATLLFVILALWQMPHFFAIGIYRQPDYAAAGIPILPVKRGLRTTKITMAIYIALFTIATILLFTFGYAGTFYLIVAIILGLAWLVCSLLGFKIPDGANGISINENDIKKNARWARQMFFTSLVVLVGVFVSMIFL